MSKQRKPNYTSDFKREKLFGDDNQDYYYEKPASYSNSEEIRRNMSYTRRVINISNSSNSSTRDTTEEDFRKKRKNKKNEGSSLLCCLLCLPFRCICQSIRATAKLACYSFIAGIVLVLIFQVFVYFSLFSTASNKYFGGTSTESAPNTLFDRTAQFIGTVLGAVHWIYCRIWL